MNANALKKFLRKVVDFPDWANEEAASVCVLSSYQNLTKHGMQRRKNKQYSDQDMQGAIVAVMNNGLSMYRACRMYGVPKETLRHRITRMKNSNSPSAVDPVNNGGSKT